MNADALAEQVLTAMPVIDGHNDLPVALRARAGSGVDGLDRHRPELHTDIPRLRAGRVGGQFWSVYVPSHLPEPEAVVATLEQIDAVYRLADAYPETFAIACTAAEVQRAIRGGRIASLIGVEGGHSLAGSLGVLRGLARLGVRYVTLTHNDNTAWADSATDAPATGGLSDTGRAIVAELNRLGILVDLSHTAASTQRDALAVSAAPVIYSHSCARGLNDHPRNVGDDELRLLKTNGGVLQLTFVPAFVSADVAAWTAEAAAERVRLGLPAVPWTWPRAPRPGESDADLAAEQAAAADAAPVEPRFAKWLAEHPRPEVSLAQVADHVEHAREVVGPAHLGLGGDYDGVDWFPADLADVSGYPRLLAELARRGWSTAELEGLTGRNILRVLRDAEDVAASPLWPTLG
ncbi:dipeptidase [Dactylosporangium sp. NPDC051485]|uniref:dipeptidase n=1 Tax=Dactylosporangium sp. NPDC051485 TaxID=3154846 RepID=UPI003431F78E